MKLQNLDNPVINFLNDQPFAQEDGEPLTLRRAIALAALAPTGEKETDEAKYSKFKLALKIEKEQVPEIEAKDIIIIRAGSAAFWAAAIHGAIVMYLEP